MLPSSTPYQPIHYVSFYRVILEIYTESSSNQRSLYYLSFYIAAYHSEFLQSMKIVNVYGYLRFNIFEIEDDYGYYLQRQNET